MSESICSRCTYLREVKNPANAEHYLACGWQGGFPAVMVWERSHINTEPHNWITRRAVYELGSIESCEVFVEKCR